jgi:uncharacterized membrane protein YeaQ/YmgE (transglycosylase-associated protein family)
MTLVVVESLVKYHSLIIWILIRSKRRHCMVGSLTGVVASKIVSEASKGLLSTLGNRT